MDPMPDKINLDFYLKLLYCEFQKYEVVTVSIVSDQPRKKDTNPSYKATKHIEPTFLISD